jgi:hypothetical protein
MEHVFADGSRLWMGLGGTGFMDSYALVDFIFDKGVIFFDFLPKKTFLDSIKTIRFETHE